MSWRNGNGKLRKDQTDHYGRVKATGKDNPFTSLTKIRDYTYEVVYDSIDYGKAKEFFNKLKPSADTVKIKDGRKANCSAFSVGNLIGRTFDYLYSNVADFVIHTPSFNTRRAVLALGNYEKITYNIVDTGDYNEGYDILPFLLSDAMNSDGLYIASLLVPADKGITTGTTPTGDLKEELCTLMLPRYIADNFSTLRDAFTFLQENASIFNATPLIEEGYELHFYVKDASGREGIIEFVNNAVVLTQGDVTTNFVNDGVIPNQDGTVYTPATQDLDHDAVVTNLITEHGSGLERYNAIVTARSSIQDKEGVLSLIRDLQYTKTYDKAVNPFWYTEYVKGDIHCNTDVAVFDAEDGPVDKGIEEFEKRDRSNPVTWATVHGGVFNIQDKTVELYFQEDYNTTYKFALPSSPVSGSSIVDSEEIVTQKEGDNTKLYLQNDLSNKIANSLQTPVATPSATELVGINNHKEQERVGIDTGTLAINNGNLGVKRFVNATHSVGDIGSFTPDASGYVAIADKSLPSGWTYDKFVDWAREIKFYDLNKMLQMVDSTTGKRYYCDLHIAGIRANSVIINSIGREEQGTSVIAITGYVKANGTISIFGKILRPETSSTPTGGMV